MKRNKLYGQIVISIVFCLAILYGGKIEQKDFAHYYDIVQSSMMKEVSKEEISLSWTRLSSTISSSPSKLVSAIAAVNESTKYGVPIDEKSTHRMMQVHAVSGGMVLKSGVNPEYGQYIQIQHDDAISIYGNLHEVNVVEAERVQRGEIIGSYDSLNQKEFYYQLQEDL